MSTAVLFTTTKQEVLSEIASRIGKVTIELSEPGTPKKKYRITERQFDIIVGSTINEAFNSKSSILV